MAFHLLTGSPRSVSIIMQKKCTFPWTPHLERFAMELAQDPEYPSDQFTIHLVRLQHVFERIDEVSVSHTPGMQGRMTEMERHIYAFRQELEDFKSQLSFTRTNCRKWTFSLVALSLFLSRGFYNHLTAGQSLSVWNFIPWSYI